MKLTEVNVGMGKQMELNRTPPVEYTQELYNHILKKFKRNGSWPMFESFQKTGRFDTYGMHRVCLAYPATYVKIVGDHLRVEKTQPTSSGDVTTLQWYKIERSQK